MARQVDVAAGLTRAAELGYGSDHDQMVIDYALVRHHRGEEAGAERTWLSYFPRDLTSWKMILASAMTRASMTAGSQQDRLGARS